MSNDSNTDTALTFCPRCGGEHFNVGNFKPWTCAECKFVFFQNTAAAAGALVLNAENKLLMVQRAKDPAKGKWGLPGGFIDGGETAEEALKRECWEEVGLKLTSTDYLCSFPNSYLYGGLSYQTLDLYFTAKAANPEQITPLDEVAAIEWFDIDKIDPGQIAFPSCRNAIDHLQTGL